MTAGSRPHRITIDDVASEANVSVATVSRALRGLPNVAISTRQRVIEVAERLGYVPDPAAARLAAGTTNTVTVVVPSLSGWYFGTVVAGAEAVCTDLGFDVLVHGIGSPHDLSRLLDESYQLERRTDGVIVVDVPVSIAEATSISARQVALATVGTSTPGHPSVGIDDEAVGRVAARHLVETGHRRIGLIAGVRDDPMGFEVPRNRHRGFVAELAELGVELDDDLVEGGNFAVDGGLEAAASLLDRAEPPTGIFAMSDEMAFGAMIELRSRHLRPGRDVGLVGVDGHEFARVVDLTTIEQSVIDRGATAARLLIDSMRHESVRPSPPFAQRAADDVARITLPTNLVVRSSTVPSESALRDV